MKYSIQSIRERYNSGERLEYLFFWGHHTKLGKTTKACLSQWFPASFVVDGVTYNCAEQYMMAEKARVFGDVAARQKVLASDDPKEIKSLGRSVENFDAEVWAEVAPKIVVKGNIHKFRQNADLRRFLLDTGDKILVEASPYDNIWGVGMQESDEGIVNPVNWKGSNLLGFALMEVRDAIAL